MVAASLDDLRTHLGLVPMVPGLTKNASGRQLRLLHRLPEQSHLQTGHRSDLQSDRASMAAEIRQVAA